MLMRCHSPMLLHVMSCYKTVAGPGRYWQGGAQCHCWTTHVTLSTCSVQGVCVCVCVGLCVQVVESYFPQAKPSVYDLPPEAREQKVCFLCFIVYCLLQQFMFERLQDIVCLPFHAGNMLNGKKYPRQHFAESSFTCMYAFPSNLRDVKSHAATLAVAACTCSAVHTLEQ